MVQIWMIYIIGNYCQGKQRAIQDKSDGHHILSRNYVILYLDFADSLICSSLLSFFPVLSLSLFLFVLHSLLCQSFRFHIFISFLFLNFFPLFRVLTFVFHFLLPSLVINNFPSFFPISSSTSHLPSFSLFPSLPSSSGRWTLYAFFIYSETFLNRRCDC